MAIITHAKCRHCSKKFPLGGDVPLIGQPLGQGQRNALGVMMAHLNERHKQELVSAQLQGGEYAGMLAMMNFQIDDEGLSFQRDFTRWKIHGLTRRAFVTDEKIAARVKGVMDDYSKRMRAAKTATEEDAVPSLEEMLCALVREMRDVLQEKDRYSPDGAPQKVPAQPDSGPAVG